MAEAIYEKFAPVLESLDRNILFIASTLETTLNLTNGIFEIQQKQIDMSKENAERLTQQSDFGELDTPEPAPAAVVEDEKKKEPKLKGDGDFDIKDILKALALAPFALKFAEGFISGITDGLIEATAEGITGLAALIRKPINSAFTKIANATSRFARTLTTVGNFISKTFGLLPGSGILKSIVGKLAWPITFILGAVDAVQAFMNTEGNLLDKIGAGLGAFAASVVGGVLDLLKGIVAWIANKLGFENFANALGEFSFSDMIKDIFTNIFNGIQGAIDVIKDLFTFGEGDMTALGVLGKLTDIVFAPVNMAINFVRGLFGFEDDGEPFKLQDWIVEKVKGIIDWIGSIFSWAGTAIVGGFTNLTDFISAAIMKPINWVKSLFEDPMAALESLRSSLLGPDGILGIITAPIDKAIAWVMGLFGIDDPDRQFSLYDTLYAPIDKAITWLQGLFTDPAAALQQAWDGLVGEGGLIDIIFAPIDKAIAWVQGIFGWGDPEEPFELSEVVKNAFRLAKDWVVGLFKWGEEAGTGEDGEWSLMNLVDAAVEKIKEFFTNLFDFLPSFADIKASLTSMLPEWMRPDSIEDQRQELLDQLAAMEQAAANALPAAEQFDAPFINDTREDFEAEAAAIREQLAALPQANQGGIINAPESGAPVMLHGQEAIVPLDSPNAANIIRDIAGATTLERKTVSIEQGSVAMSGQPQTVVISGGNSARGGDTYNNGGNTSTTTIINQSSDPVRALRHMPT
jgi:hypothetical protein